ncbi:MAG: DUF1858 domain-containing protein [Candidatus Peribacteraceae bacterium]|nr:DUF1858 domain-containing protein [Candidatus Peribacteraceae bacterium]
MVAVSASGHNRQAGKKPRKAAPSAVPAVTADMRVADIASLLPEALPVMAEYGLHCVGCSANGLESLGEGCRLHGFAEEEIAALLEDLNGLLQRQPGRPQTLTITDAAAAALRQVMEGEGKRGEGLVVTVDGRGGFCMEFRKEAQQGERTFSPANDPSLRVFASPLTLSRVGGSTIDHREGRFKLDLLEEACTGDGACGKECGCT